jgi:hypothetical protein
LALIQAISSLRFVAGTEFGVTMICGALGSSETGSKSFTTSYCRSYIAGLTTCVLQSPMPSVYPSGAARAARPTASEPAAPVTFSTITGWPSATFMRSAMMRAIVSDGPPTAYPTSIVMGRAG